MAPTTPRLKILSGSSTHQPNAPKVAHPPLPACLPAHPKGKKNVQAVPKIAFSLHFALFSLECYADPACFAGRLPRGPSSPCHHAFALFGTAFLPYHRPPKIHSASYLPIPYPIVLLFTHSFIALFLSLLLFPFLASQLSASPALLFATSFFSFSSTFCAPAIAPRGRRPRHRSPP